MTGHTVSSVSEEAAPVPMGEANLCEPCDLFLMKHLVICRHLLIAGLHSFLRKSNNTQCSRRSGPRPTTVSDTVSRGYARSLDLYVVDKRLRHGLPGISGLFLCCFIFKRKMPVDSVVDKTGKRVCNKYALVILIGTIRYQRFS
jgi:hypothetical protein